MKLVKVAAIALAMSAFTVQAIDFKKPEDAVEHRQVVMKVISKKFSQLTPVLKNTSAYDSKKFAVYAERLAVLATWVEDSFEKNIQTSRSDSKDEIWAKDSKYKQLVAEFTQHTAELSAVAGSGDVAKVQQALKQVAGDCKACHKPFRH